jgi:ADP-ribosylglycohydrolase
MGLDKDTRRNYWEEYEILGSCRQDQFVGCLIGQCLGDAAGFPVEGATQHVCKKYVEEILKTDIAGTVGRARQGMNWPFGQYTDDSQLARELFRSFKECGTRFKPKDYAQKIANIFHEKKIVGYGRTTKEAAIKIKQGTSWKRSGKSNASSNGSAMRAAPIGLFFYDQPKKMVCAAIKQSLITHRDPRCFAGSVAIASATALCYQESLFDRTEPEEFAIKIAKLVKPIHEPMAEAIEQLPKWITLPKLDVFDKIVALREPNVYNKELPDGWQGITPDVTESVLWSLFSFLRTPDDYWESICTAIEVGGDVDTTAAMTGAISGTLNGVGSIRVDLVEKLIDRFEWDAQALIDLASSCFWEIYPQSVRLFGISGMEADHYQSQKEQYKASIRSNYSPNKVTK